MASNMTRIRAAETAGRARFFGHEPYPSLPGDYAAFYENIYRHIHHGKPLQSDAREVVGVIRLIEAAWESSRMQCVVRI